MGMDLRGAGGDFRFSKQDWVRILDLAQQYGWEPQGTAAPRRGYLTDPHYEALQAAWSKQMMHAYEHDLEPPPEPDIPEDAWTYEEDPDWDGSYMYNSYQCVTAEDAANLAAALERALPDIPDYNVTEVKMRSGSPLPEGTPDPIAYIGAQLGGMLGYYGPAADCEPIEWFSGEMKYKVVEFIAYCKAGSFMIG